MYEFRICVWLNDRRDVHDDREWLRNSSCAWTGKKENDSVARIRECVRELKMYFSSRVIDVIFFHFIAFHYFSISIYAFILSLMESVNYCNIRSPGL